MDPFEDFEFKPLTEGLGFNKKAETLKSDIKSTMATLNNEPTRSTIFPPAGAVKNEDRAATKSFNTPLTEPDRHDVQTTRATIETSRSASQSISELMASLPPSLDFLDDKQDLTRVTPSARPQIYQPLAPREASSTIATGPTVGSVLPAPGTKAGSPMAAATVAAPTVGTPAILGGGTSANRTGYAERMFESFGKTAQGQLTAETQTTGELVPVAVNFSAALIDAMVVAGISTILLVCIITITHINLVAMLTNTATDLTTQKNLVFLAIAVLQMYMLVSRAFFGSTLGEWAFDTQLGTDDQQRKLYYPAQVVWRSLFITFTGLFALPLLSFAFKRDLGKYISGVQLLRRA